ncbi:mobile mystery protein B [Brevundimonas aurantiaca]|uniref:mobile mystery protein B n=1 Tax=Brevundimonas aurantiaca TaxID=74316 RepID=UPI001D186459|nr:mobile mystery protein B [Brevundimonas aurantiaca]MCC4293843.1 mobile mystery protein B [Brevundimonas aurantiaca]
MSDPLFDAEDDAATPLTPDERAQLIPTYITTRAQLNEAEQANIADADLWAFRRKRDVLDEAFLLNLHKRMLNGVWKWAGSFRQTERNIGIQAYRIGVELRQLLDDVRYWVEHQTFSPDEIAVRFHHRLVFIHPFPNGNGRHARLAADLLAVQLGQERFSWGSANLVTADETRATYVAALKAADAHDIGPLLAFARS